MSQGKAAAPDSTPMMLWITRILAAIALAIAGYLLLNGDSAGGAVAGAIAFGLALFHYIPMVTEVSGFGVTAKLQREVQQAEEILEQIRGFASAYARSTFHQMAWMNRMGAPSDQTVREQVASLDGLMSTLGISSGDQRQVKRPFIMMIGFDITLALMSLIRRHSFAVAEEVQKEINAHTNGQAVAAGDEIYRQLLEKKRRVTLKREGPKAEDYDKIENMPQTFSEILTSLEFSPEDKAVIMEEVRKGAAIFTDCVASGTKTVEAERFIEQDHPQGEYHKLVFGK